MSQTGMYFTAPGVFVITPNAGGAVGPDIFGNINLFGTDPIEVTGNPAMHTLTITVAAATTAQIGVVTLATNAETIAGASTVKVVTPDDLKAKLGTQTLHGLPTGTGTAAAIAWTAEPANGQLLIGSTGNVPALGTLTPGVGIAVTNAAGSITVATTGAVPKSFVTDVLTATPAVGVLNILTQNATLGCGSSVYFSAPGPANTVQLNVTDGGRNTLAGTNAGNLTLTGTDNVSIGMNSLHALTSGSENFAGGNLAMDRCTSGSDNVSIGMNSLAFLTTSNNNTAVGKSSLGILVTGASNIALGFNAGSIYAGAESSNIVIGHVGILGESNHIRIGTTGGGAGQQNKTWIAGVYGVTPDVAGPQFVVMDNTGQLGTTASGGGITWTLTTVNAGIVVNNGYLANKVGLLTMTLPATAAIGDIIEIANMNTAVGWRIAQNANQFIRVGNNLSTVGVGGYVEATALGDSLKLVCNVAGANTGWIATSMLGNLTVV